MPQGKGTYGSQVGRPPKKKKYQTGGSVDPFSAKNPEGIVAEKAMEAIEGMNAIPTANAQDRSQASPMGEEVGTGMYAVGGMIRMESQKKRDVAKLVERQKKAQKKEKSMRRLKKGLKTAGAAMGRIESPLAKEVKTKMARKAGSAIGKALAKKSVPGKAKRKKK